MSASTTQPALFISHGSPMLALDRGPYAQALQAYWAGLEPKPKAVLVISAHWLTGTGCRVTAQHTPAQIYDFGGFPEALYRIVYPAQGSPEVAARACALLRDEGFGCEPDLTRGLDHGAWVPLKLAMPEA